MTTTVHPVGDGTTARRTARLNRLVQVDLAIALVALLVILGVTAVDHASQGGLAALAALLGV